MRHPFAALLFIILLSISISAQEIDSQFQEKQLREAAVNAGRNNISNLYKLPAAKSEIIVSDSLIRNIISDINPDSVKKFISGLQSFGTRYLLDSNRDQVALWIKQQYLNMGFTDVVIDSFNLFGTWQKNVIATLPGKQQNEVCIVGGHYDSIIHTSYTTPAPGADDNASGTTMALEIARAFKQKKYTPECTVKFLAFGAEELGLYGSADYAAKCAASGMNIKLMINADMISYTSRPLGSSQVSINYYTGCDSWLWQAKSMVSKYTAISPVDGSLNSAGSDSHSFWKQGYQVIYFEEDQFSPFYHTTADTIGNYSMPYCAEVIKAACALLINTCALPAPVQKISLFDVGDGNSLKAVWAKSASSKINSYKVYAGSASQKYDITLSTTDTTCIIKNRQDGMPVFVAVSAITNDGIESLLSEKSLTICSIPAAPVNVSLTSAKKQITISWSRGSFALDFAGYNIYRADSLNGKYIKLNLTVLSDTLFIDTKAIPGIEHIYFVSSIDNSGNESVGSNIARGRLLTMDQGIGLIVTSSDGDGTIGNPSKKQVESFYKSMLGGFKYQVQDLSLSKVVSFSSIGAFSTVIWANNSASENSTLLSSLNEIVKYLKVGGNLLLTTYFPTTALSTSSGYVKTFKSGDMIFDYFKIGSSKYQMNAKFSGALAKTTDLPNILIDTNKTTADYLHQLSGVEIIMPNDAGKTIYTYDSFNESNPFKTYPIGVEYLGADYKTVTVSFPLYYMNEKQVKEFIAKVVHEKFSEPVAVNDKAAANSVPLNYELHQNYPNPFNPETVIEYSLPNSGSVSIKVYDVLGREIRTLVNTEQTAGKYSINFNAAGLSSGVYYYKLQSGSFVQTRKMMLVK